MRRLQRQYRKGTQELLITDEDLEDIPKYAFDYEQGGWEMTSRPFVNDILVQHSVGRTQIE